MIHVTHCELNGRRVSIDELCFYLMSHPLRAVFKNPGTFDIHGNFVAQGSFDSELCGFYLAFHIVTDESHVIDTLTAALNVNKTLQA